MVKVRTIKKDRMIYLITFSYILLKAEYDTYRIHRKWGGKDIKHWIIDLVGFSLVGCLVYILEGALNEMLISYCLFMVCYSLFFSPLLNLFRVVFLGHVLGHKFDELRTDYDSKEPYKWGDVVRHTDGTSTWLNKSPWWSYSKALAILCYRSHEWYYIWTYKVFPGSDIRLRWSLELSLLIILIYFNHA